MKILIDMNLTPKWCDFLNQHGHDSLHWSKVGDPRAPDLEICSWAGQNGFIVFTHDLDFSAILAATQANGPSVIQVRTHRIMPEEAGGILLSAIKEHEEMLLTGAIVVIDEIRARVRILPLG